LTVKGSELAAYIVDADEMEWISAEA